VGFHEPYYSSKGTYTTGTYFKQNLEPLFYQHGVDIVINGHVHAYERSYPVYNGTVRGLQLSSLMASTPSLTLTSLVPYGCSVFVQALMSHSNIALRGLIPLSAGEHSECRCHHKKTLLIATMSTYCADRRVRCGVLCGRRRRQRGGPQRVQRH